MRAIVFSAIGGVGIVSLCVGMYFHGKASGLRDATSATLADTERINKTTERIEKETDRIKGTQRGEAFAAISVFPLTKYGPWEDDRYVIQQHGAPGFNAPPMVTNIRDKALRREITLCGSVVISVYEFPPESPPQPAPPVPQKEVSPATPEKSEKPK